VKESEFRHREVFRGRWSRPLAYLWFVVAGYLVIASARRGDGSQAAVVCAAAAVITVVVYALAFRPAVVIDDGGVLLRNIARDIYVPWSKVDDIDRSWVLSVHAGGRRFVAWAVSARNPTRQGRAATTEASAMPGGIGGIGGIGGSKVQAGVAAAATAVGDAPAGPSEQVVERWMRWRHKVPDTPMTVTYLWPLAAALAVALAALAVAAVLA
jgi:hypothetical protein